MKELEVYVKRYHKKYKIIEKIRNISASDRLYYIISNDIDKKIVCYSENISENKTFIYLSKIINKTTKIAPTVEYKNKDVTIYSQTYNGEKDMLSYLYDNNLDTIIIKYKEIIDNLINCQISVSKSLDNQRLFNFKKLDRFLIYRDLFQFKNYFLDQTTISYSEYELIKDINKFAVKIEKLDFQYFIFRDFQARNILLNQDEDITFIDFQGGVEGCILYDLISLTWQAKANFHIKTRLELKNYYKEKLQNYIKVDDAKFEYAYNYCLIERLLQVLGVYGLQGLIKHKKHFRESIKLAIINLNYIIELKELKEYKELTSICKKLIKDYK